MDYTHNAWVKLGSLHSFKTSFSTFKEVDMTIFTICLLSCLTSKLYFRPRQQNIATWRLV